MPPRRLTLLRSPVAPDVRPSEAGEDDSVVADAELVLRIRRRDRWAEAELYRRHARVVSNLAARLLGSRDEAMDVLQETFVMALERVEDLRDPGSVRAWLLQIAVNLVHRRFRRRKMLSRLGFRSGDSQAAIAWQPTPDASPETLAEVARVRRVLEALPIRQRTAWVLHRVEGESLPVVAEACSVSLATVKRDIAAAHEMILAATEG